MLLTVKHCDYYRVLFLLGGDQTLTGEKMTVGKISGNLWCFPCVCAWSVASVVSNSFVTPWTVACQALLSLEILQTRILWCVAISFSRESAKPRQQTCGSSVGRRILSHWATWEADVHLFRYWDYNFKTQSVKMVPPFPHWEPEKGMFWGSVFYAMGPYGGLLSLLPHDVRNIKAYLF